MDDNIFQKYMKVKPLFKKNRDTLRPSYVPDELPHRNNQIEQLASILSIALRGEKPSNVMIFGKTGTGKTATIKYLQKEMERFNRTTNEDQPLVYIYINCEIVDTHYGVLTHIGNRFIQKWDERIPFTGWPTETVYSRVLEEMDKNNGIVIVIMDEIDKLVYKSGDDVLYHLMKINDDLKNAKLSIIGISNDLKFIEFLDPRVKSRLGEEKMVFPPYNAEELKDILQQRAEMAFFDNVISISVISLCAALAAQEHGDARRAIDLLRVAGELAERNGKDNITESYMYKAKNKIELDCIAEVIRTLPSQSKLVLLGISLNNEAGLEKLTTGQVYDMYRVLCDTTGTTPLTQRRVGDLISELDMLGIINSRVISKGRYGRTREISLAVSRLDVRNVIEEDDELKGITLPKAKQLTLL